MVQVGSNASMGLSRICGTGSSGVEQRTFEQNLWQDPAGGKLWASEDRARRWLCFFMRRRRGREEDTRAAPLSTWSWWWWGSGRRKPECPSVQPPPPPAPSLLPRLQQMLLLTLWMQRHFCPEEPFKGSFNVLWLSSGVRHTATKASRRCASVCPHFILLRASIVFFVRVECGFVDGSTSLQLSIKNFTEFPDQRPSFYAAARETLNKHWQRYSYVKGRHCIWIQRNKWSVNSTLLKGNNVHLTV